MVRMPKVPDGWFDAESEYLGDGGDRSPMTNGQSESQGMARAEGVSVQTQGPKNPIGPVKGYPEMGRDAWRAGNDAVIVGAVNKYNFAKNLFPGDAEYMTPKLMKTWMMRESGGSPEAFKSDPFQVNNHGDWVPEKGRIAGLTEGQKMTPDASAEAALKWLHYKGRIDESQKLGPYQGHYEALRKYNAAASRVPGIPKGADYANAVLNSAWTSYGDWQK